VWRGNVLGSRYVSRSIGGSVETESAMRQVAGFSDCGFSDGGFAVKRLSIERFLDGGF